jgi:alkanesulfonate monooxygenase SsuD/methylene tetrahydromethanopterin reductase-like flavin-dependent oxidoreductase (luciferase family)
MKFGLFSFNHREYAVAAESWEEDIWEVQLAEELGFEETWVAEHITATFPDQIPAVDLFICKAAALTTKMRFGPGVRPLPYFHPVHVAAQAAVCDHLTGGRYMAGFGGAREVAGRGPGYFRQLGIAAEGSDKRAMMHEAIELILKCWSEREPFDFHGKFWQGEGIRVLPKPLQQPRMPVGMANSESISSAQLAGEQGFWPMYSQYDTPAQLRELSTAFLEAGRAAGREPSRNDIRICRTVYVADTDERARDEARPAIEHALKRAKRGPALAHVVRSLPSGGTVDDVTADYMIDSGLFFVGSPDTVYRQVMDFYDGVGGFGMLLFVAGSLVGTREQREHSWQLFTKEVAPQLADLDANRLVHAAVATS